MLDGSATATVPRVVSVRLYWGIETMNEQSTVYSDCVQKPVLVVGANGFFGSHITRQLVEAGRQVRVLVRRTSNTAAIDGLAVERHYGDVGDSQSLRAAMAGCGSVFYCVVDTRAWLTDPAPLYRCNVEGLGNALGAAQAEQVARFIFTSSIATIGRSKTGAASERDAFNWWDVAPHYIRSRVEAENLLLDWCRERSFPGIALCVANTYGPGDYQPTPQGQLLWQAASGKLRFALNCSAPTVDIRDAARAALLAERFGRVAERYIVSSSYISQAQFYTLAAARLGNAPPRKLPMRVAYALAAINECVAKIMGRKDIRLCRDSIFLSEVFGALDNTKICQEFGWAPRPLEQTVEDAIAWYVDQRGVTA